MFPATHVQIVIINDNRQHAEESEGQDQNDARDMLLPLYV